MLIQLGLAFSFAYAAIGGFMKPENWIGWFPRSVLEAWPGSDGSLLAVWGVLELILALWLISGWKLEAAGWVSAVLLFGVTAANIASMDIVFRDIALGLAACGLAMNAREKTTV